MNEVITFVEIDVPTFTGSGGSGSPPTITYRFTYPNSDRLPLFDSIPSLSSVNVTPAVIDPGRTIGQRESITVTFNDHLHVFDTDAHDAGTFWTKFRARYPSLEGYRMRVLRGDFDDAYEDL